MMCLTGRNTRCCDISYGVRILIIAILYFHAGNVSSSNITWNFSQSIESSSNVILVPEYLDDGSYDDIYFLSSVTFKMDEEASDLKSLINLSVSYLNYSDNISNDVTRNGLDAEFIWTITPGYYKWILEDSYLQTSIDPSLIFNDSNTQNVNIIKTGPKLEWKLYNSKLYLDSLITNTNYSESNQDNSSVLSSLKWGKSFSGGIKADVSYSVKFLTYSSSAALGDYNQSTAGLGVEYERYTNKVNLFIGATHLNSDDVEKNNFETSSVGYRRKMSKYSSLNLLYSKGLSNQDDTVDSGGTVLSNLFVNENTTVVYQRDRNGFGFNVRYFDNRRSESDSSYSDDVVGSEVKLSRILSENSLILFTYSEKHTVVNNNGDYFYDDRYETGLDFIKKYNNKLTLRLYHRDINNGSSSVTRQYKDQRTGLTISISR